jgi:hypothetical protein
MRADPPGRASSGSRRRVFAASLEQSEQLWRASIAVAPAAQPITAFYGLSQAGRALSAALSGGNNWVLNGHGLVIDPPPVAPPSPVADVVVRDKGNGSFQQIAALLQSPTLTSPTRLGELWQSLPEQGGAPLSGENSPLALLVSFSELELPIGSNTADRVLAYVRPLPAHLSRNDLTLAEALAFLAPYPTLMQPAPPVELASVDPRGDDGTWLLGLRWDLPQRTSDYETAYARLRQLVRMYGPQMERPRPMRGWAIPAVGGNSRPMHPLLTWWAMLFSMSMLARYQPSTWMGMLNVDRSGDAVPLEMLLQSALSIVPGLLYDEMR